MLLKTKQYILDQELTQKHNLVLVGVSGGPDSIALIHNLYQLRYDLGIQIQIAHYNHALRKGSTADQHLVQELAESLNIPIHIDQWLHTHSKPKGSLEEIARQKRLNFFKKIAKKIHADCVALGHTKDDLAETVLMRILRGTGLQGMRSIMPKTRIEGLIVIRPFLDISKIEILDYLKKKKIDYRLDPSNKDIRFMRNKIRRQLIPLLQDKYNSNLIEVLSNLSINTALDYDFLLRHSKELFRKTANLTKLPSSIQMDIAKIRKIHAALQRMLIRLSIETINGNTNRITLNHIEEIQDLIKNRPTGSIVDLPGKIGVRKDKNTLNLYIRNT